MASNRPAGQSWESYVDALFRQARENGEFDHLPGSGKPIKGLDEPYDENWWLKQYMAREELSISPDTLKLKKEIVEELDALWRIPGEDQVRKKLTNINTRILMLNSRAHDGPPLNISMLNVDALVDAWRERRQKPRGLGVNSSQA